MRVEWVASSLALYVGTRCIQHYYRWCAHLGCQQSTELTPPPADLNGLVRLPRKTKSGFCACAITFQTCYANAVTAIRLTRCVWSGHLTACGTNEPQLINAAAIFGMTGLLTMSVFCGSSLMWLICPTPSVICLPYCLKFLSLFVVFIGGWLGYEIARFVIGDGLFSIYYYGASSFAGSMWFIPFFLLMVFLLVLWGLVIWRQVA
jgi:hypothetical protein